MTFISYSQNFEDVMLNRVLKNVERGFYIDVGANDPVVDSVTKAFYERGWRGINIEPVQYWYDKCCADRPEDRNIKVAVSTKVSSITLFEIIDTGMSTIDAEIARRHANDGYEVKKIEVPTQTLDSICDENGVSEVHFLKVDVEGAEREVLDSFSFDNVRPWVVLVEATEPNSPVQNYEKWENILLSRAYEFMYFDGLNRFYIAREHAELAKSFDIPPNYFDNFQLYSHLQAIAERDAQLAERDAQLAERDAQLAERDAQIQKIYSSASWRVTAPLRKIKRLFYGIFHASS